MEKTIKIFFKILFFIFFIQISAVNAQEFLNPETAFRPEITALNENTFLIHYKIAKNHYLYKERFQFNVENFKIKNIKFPQGKIKKDDIFGEVEVFYNDLPIEIQLENNYNNYDNNQNFLNVNVEAISQGCSNEGLCYLPVTHHLNVLLFKENKINKNKENNQENNLNKNENFKNEDFNLNNKKDESNQILNQLKNTNFLTNLFFFFLAGIGLSLTPCVLPMIPILSGIIIQQHSQNTKQKNHFLLSLIYVLGMALTYTLAGIFAGLSGTLLSQFLQNAFVLFSFAFIFILLSFSMFGFYELQMPSLIQNKLNHQIKNKKGGGFSVFIMGILSALIVGPCVAAPLAGALMYIGQTGDAFLGGFALFSLALGMGLPLILVGFLGASILPRTGMWMIYIKKTFGVILLGLALWILNPILETKILMFLWASLLIITSVYLKTFDSLQTDANSIQRFLKGIGILLFLIGLVLFIGSFSNAKDFFNPLENIIYENNKNNKTIENDKLNFQTIKNNEELDFILKNENQNILLDFSAEWCVVCKEMERYTFKNENVLNKMKTFKLLKVDLTNNQEEEKKILKRFNLFGPPAILFFKNGLEKNRVVGFKNSEDFLKIMNEI